MPRKEKIIRDRVKMVSKALTKAGYLSEEESSQAQWTQAFFDDLAMQVLADLLHLGLSRGLEIEGSVISDGVINVAQRSARQEHIQARQEAIAPR